ncbi:MAG: substrate-binding domain-containing protein [Lachnospiraceae bacterium]|nr:substrate-binding domain-containing protein [Lachnospiraceae bacterium]
MKRRIGKYNLILTALVVLLLALLILFNMQEKEDAYIHVGIAAYDLDDTFMEHYIDDLESTIQGMKIEGKKISYEIYDAQGSTKRQERQLQYMFAQRYDVMLVNLVEPASAANVLNDAKETNVPVILFNREVDKKDMEIAKDVWYIGTDAKAAGAIQGEMLKKLWEEKSETLDRNQNGKLDYVLVEGEETHFDAIRRTNGFLKASESLPLHQRGYLTANWKRELAYEKFAKLDKDTIKNTEAVICNNDDMALGIYDYYKKQDLKVPVILGINNSEEMHRKIVSGKIYGTVDNRMEDQVDAICKLVKAIVKGNAKSSRKVWYSAPHEIVKRK